MTKATTAQIRTHYKTQGADVRISRDGRVTYRLPGGSWLEGRWIGDYVVQNNSVVLI